jgi:hypothetical protein
MTYFSTLSSALLDFSILIIVRFIASSVFLSQDYPSSTSLTIINGCSIVDVYWKLLLWRSSKSVWNVVTCNGKCKSSSNIQALQKRMNLVWFYFTKNIIFFYCSSSMYSFPIRNRRIFPILFFAIFTFACNKRALQTKTGLASERFFNRLRTF